MSELEYANLARLPLAEINASSQNSQSQTITVQAALQKAPNVVDLSSDTDLAFVASKRIDDVASLPIVKAKGRKTVASKPRAPATKQTASVVKGGAPAKKVKKSKIEIEFEKLSPKDMIEFLSSRINLINELQLLLDQGDDMAMSGCTAGTTEGQPPLSSSGNANDANQLCQLRLELGSVLSQESELRARERRLRLSIKRLQRKITLAQSPIVCKQRETQPILHVAEKLFASITNTNNSRSSDTAREVIYPKAEVHSVNALWLLAQQNKQFDAIAAPRLLDVERDATLREIIGSDFDSRTSSPCGASLDSCRVVLEVEDIDIAAASTQVQGQVQQQQKKGPTRMVESIVHEFTRPSSSKATADDVGTAVNAETNLTLSSLVPAVRSATQVGTEEREIAAALEISLPVLSEALLDTTAAENVDVYDVMDDSSTCASAEGDDTTAAAPLEAEEEGREREATIKGSRKRALSPVQAVGIPLRSSDFAVYSCAKSNGAGTAEPHTMAGAPGAAESKTQQLFRQFEYRSSCDDNSSLPARARRSSQPSSTSDQNKVLPGSLEDRPPAGRSKVISVPASAAVPVPPPAQAPSVVTNAATKAIAVSTVEVLFIDLTSPETTAATAAAEPERSEGAGLTVGVGVGAGMQISIDLVSQSQSQDGPSSSQSQSQQLPQASSQALLQETAAAAAEKKVDTTESTGSSAPESLPLSDSTPSEGMGCVIHYVPSVQSQQNSQASAAGFSSVGATSSAAAVASTTVGISGAAAAGEDSQHSNSDRSTSSEEIRNILDSTEEPEFSAMPVQKLRDIVLHYGLRTDSKGRMVSLLRAMWQRLHSTLSSTSASTTAPTAETDFPTTATLGGSVTAPVVVAAQGNLNSEGKRAKLVGSTRTAATAGAGANSVIGPKSTKRLSSSSAFTAAVGSQPPNLSTTGSDEGPLPKKARKPPASASSSSSQLTQSATSAAIAAVAAASAVAGCGARAAATKREFTAEDLAAFLKSHPEWYEQVLCFIPLDLDKLQAAILSDCSFYSEKACTGPSGYVATAGVQDGVGGGDGGGGAAVVKVSKVRLRELLDEMAVFVSATTNSRNHHKKASTLKSKTKSSQQTQL